MNDIPTAVISGARRGAPRKGRYATNSMLALIRPQATMATASDPSSATTSAPVDEWALSPNTVMSIVAEIIPPSMNRSPCAKLINSRIPYTSV